MQEAIEIGYQAFVSDGGRSSAQFGRFLQGPARTGDLRGECRGSRCAAPAVESVHSQKVILSCGKLERRLRQAIGHAHDEEPNA